MAKYRKMLNNWNADYIQSLVKLIETQSKTTLVQWSLTYAEDIFLPIWKSLNPSDNRPQKAIEMAKEWVLGKVKLPEVKKIILECHAAARENEDNPTAQAIARAIGQACSTIHSARHCIGLPLYGALGIAYYKCGLDKSYVDLEKVAARECFEMEMALKNISVIDEPNKANISWKC